MSKFRIVATLLNFLQKVVFVFIIEFSMKFPVEKSTPQILKSSEKKTIWTWSSKPILQNLFWYCRRRTNPVCFIAYAIYSIEYDRSTYIPVRPRILNVAPKQNFIRQYVSTVWYPEYTQRKINIIIYPGHTCRCRRVGASTICIISFRNCFNSVYFLIFYSILSILFCFV